MPLNATLIGRYPSSSGHGAGGFTTPSFTPTAGRKILAIAFAQSQSDDAMEGADLTISDSDSGITSWEAASHTVSSPGWAYGTRAWLSEQGASGSAMTVTVDAGSFAVQDYRVDVYECQDADGIGATMVATDPDGDGAVSPALSAAPAASSIVFACANVALGVGTSTVNEGAGWTEESGADTTIDAWFAFQVMRRTGSTSAAVDWADLSTGAGPIGATLMAFEITQAAAGVSLTPADPIEVSGSLAIAGDVGFEIKRWRVLTNAPQGTQVHVMVFSGSSPTYALLTQGTTTVDASGFAQVPAAGTIGTKALAVVHDFDDDEETTSIHGGPCIAEIIDAG